MGKLETLTTLGIQDTGRRQTKQKGPTQHRKLKRSVTRIHKNKNKYKKKNEGKPRYP